MLAYKEQLVEVIRFLEENNHVFKNDPSPITNSLKASNLGMKERLISRATRIDADQAILNRIIQTHARIKLTFSILALAWVALGFLGLVVLMQSASVNFFYLLASILGMHTVMLILWVFFVTKGLMQKQRPHLWLLMPGFLIKQSDPVTKATTTVFTWQLQQKGMRWFVGKLTHQLWLATLAGMFGAIIFLLMVKQYQFNWQSTLLTPNTLTQVIAVISWLPSQLGFSVPNSADVMISQSLSASSAVIDGQLARKWAGLLIGSLISYGIIPRCIAWLVCWYMLGKQQFELPLNQAYYQQLIQHWSVAVVDADDMPTLAPIKAPKAEANKHNPELNIACLLDTISAPSNWHHDVLATAWQVYGENAGVIEDREQLKSLLAYLNKHDAQLLVGIRSEALPDRGMMNKLSKLADASKSGMAVILINAKQDMPNVRLQQWHEALAKNHIQLVQT